MEAAPWRRWRHITKLDPDRPNTPELVRAVAQSGTDAVVVSGTQRVTGKKIQGLLDLLRPYPIPRVLEPADPGLVVFEPFDYVFVPSVLNSGDPTFILGLHARWAQKSPAIQWEKVVPEAYIVLNAESAVGRFTRARPLTAEEAAAHAHAAENYFGFPIIYVECSGVFGSPEVVKAVKQNLTKARLLYGGGIDSRERAREMLQHADTIVVGNVLYEKGVERYLETVPG